MPIDSTGLSQAYIHSSNDQGPSWSTVYFISNYKYTFWGNVLLQLIIILIVVIDIDIILYNVDGWISVYETVAHLFGIKYLFGLCMWFIPRDKWNIFAKLGQAGKRWLYKRGMCLKAKLLQLYGQQCITLTLWAPLRFSISSYKKCPFLFILNMHLFHMVHVEVA